MRKFLFYFAVVFIMSINESKADNKDSIFLKNGDSFSGMILTQKPGTFIIFKKDNRETVFFDINMVKQIKRELHDKEVLSGLGDVIETRQGETIKGQIIVQELGKSIGILSDSIVHTIAIQDISVQKKERLNLEQDLFSQAPYIDVVESDEKRYVGIITKQDYGNDSIGSVLFVTDSLNNENAISIQSIKQMSRIPNDRYKEIKRFKVVPGKVYFNRIQGKKTSVKFTKKYLYVTSNAIKDGITVSTENDKLLIETDDTPAHRHLLLTKLDQVKDCQDQRIEINKLRMLIKEPLSYSAANGLLKWEYEVENGIYLFLNEDFQNLFFITIRHSK